MGASGAFAGALVIVAMIAALIVLVILTVAPLKLYSIHNELKQTNALLAQTNALLAQSAENGKTQIRLLAALANGLLPEDEAPSPPPTPSVQG